MRELERSEERDAAITAMLPQVAVNGWTVQALRLGLAEAAPGPAGPAGDAAEWLFSGPADMIEAYLDLADRRMTRAAASLPPKLSARIRALIALRLDQAEAERPAARRAVAMLSLPGNTAAAGRTLARTVDAIWHTAADRSADFSWYTKRATLAAVYAATVVYWMNQDAESDPGNVRTLGFLDRRLAGLGRIGKLRARIFGPSHAPPDPPSVAPAAVAV